jgi:ubiquitin-protein ligase
MVFFVNVTPSDGLYTGATFKFQVTIPPSYPYDPPKVECQTLVYHPNIDWEGHVCLNILRADWMPVLNLGSVLFGLVTLFLVRLLLHRSRALSVSMIAHTTANVLCLSRSPTRMILSTRRRRS